MGSFIFAYYSLDFLIDINDNNKALRIRTIGVAVNMSPCHGEDHGFDSRMVRQALFNYMAR